MFLAIIYLLASASFASYMLYRTKVAKEQQQVDSYALIFGYSLGLAGYYLSVQNLLRLSGWMPVDDRLKTGAVALVSFALIYYLFLYLMDKFANKKEG